MNLTKPRLAWIFIFAAVILLAACGGADTDAPAAEADLQSALELPKNIDVHTAASVLDQDDVFFLDVREQWEYDEAHIPGINLIPMGEVPARLNEIPKDKQVIVTCRTGNRSDQIAQLLRDNGFDNISNMTGGIVDWQAAGYPVEP